MTYRGSAAGGDDLVANFARAETGGPFASFNAASDRLGTAVARSCISVCPAFKAAGLASMAAAGPAVPDYEGLFSELDFRRRKRQLDYGALH